MAECLIEADRRPACFPCCMATATWRNGCSTNRLSHFTPSPAAPKWDASSRTARVAAHADGARLHCALHSLRRRRPRRRAAQGHQRQLSQGRTGLHVHPGAAGASRGVEENGTPADRPGESVALAIRPTTGRSSARSSVKPPRRESNPGSRKPSPKARAAWSAAVGEAVVAPVLLADVDPATPPRLPGRPSTRLALRPSTASRRPSRA